MDGVIIINKPKGFTSQDVVSKVKKILNIKKAGHTGTLDPLATGVLPVLLGGATKLSKYLIEHDKIYRAKIKFGIKTDTGDSEGKCIEKSDKRVYDIDLIKQSLNKMLGKQMQIPPMYSAVKVNGRKLYEYAREGIEIKREPREIEIYKLELINFNEKEQELEVDIACSKGTYIRVLCENIAELLDTVGYMSELNRISVDNFLIEDAIDFEILESNKNNNVFLEEKIIKMEDIFKEYPKIVLNKRKRELFLNGVMLTFEKADGLYNVYGEDDKYIGLGSVSKKLLKRDIVM